MKIIKIVLLVLVSLIFLLWFVRLILPSQVDDVNPLMNCSDEVLGRGDVYFVVPKFEGVEISGEWCEEIKKNLNSSKGFGIWDLGFEDRLAMHGVLHTYEEFGEARSEEYFNEGVRIMNECFGVAPERFKPGQLKWTSENDWIREEMDVELFWNQVFHKVYHCGDSGVFPNWVVRFF